MKLLKCRKCGSYTLREECPKCGARTGTAHPPKYSPEDKYARFRRKERYG